EHGVTDLDSYLRAPWFRATLEEITDEDGSIATNINEKMCMPDFILTPPTDESVITYTQLSGVQGVDTQSHILPTIQTQFSDINLSFVSQQATASHVIDDVMRQLSFDETKLDGEAGFADVTEEGCGQTHEPILLEVSNQEPIMAEVSNEVPIEEEVGTQEFSVEDVVVKDYVSSGDDVKQGNRQQNESAFTDGQFFYDDEGIVMHMKLNMMFSIVKMQVQMMMMMMMIMDLPFENIGITNLVSDDVLGKDVDVINEDGFDNDLGNDEEKITGREEARDKVYLHSNESIMNLKLYKNYGVRIRARCDRKVPVFTMSQDAHDKGDLYPWVLYVRKDKFIKKWVVKTHNDTHTCLQSREIIHYTYKFLSKKIFEQVRISLDIPFKAVQDKLQRELESTNHNTIVKIAVERNIVPSLPTRVFQRIYICLRVLKLGIRACRRDRLGLDGAFIKGSFPGQVLVAVRLDSNNRVYPLAYALAEAEKSIKKEAHLMKVQWNRVNKYQVLGLLGDHATPRNLGQSLLLVEYIEGNILSQDTTYLWDQVLEEVHMSNNTFATQASCLGKEEPSHVNHAETLDTIRQHAKDKVERQQQVVISASSYKCVFVSNRLRGKKFGVGGNNTKASGSASGQAQQTGHVVGQDGSGGSGAGAVIGLSAAGEGGLGVASQGLSRSRWKKRRVQTKRISPQKRTPTQSISQPSSNSQVPMSKTKNAYGRKIGDGVPT
nr:hypothetical protein [Tanacetum cinerariifolium]